MSDEETRDKPDTNAGDVASELPPEPPKSRSVLLDILEKTRDDSEAETAKLMSSLHQREEDNQRRIEEENRKKAEESRKKIEEERGKREAAIREYELRKARKADEERERAEAEKAADKAEEPLKSRFPLYAAVTVVLLAAIGAGAWTLIPRGKPAVFTMGMPLDAARPGMYQVKPVEFGPSTIVFSGGVMSPDKLVVAMKPKKYQASPPKPVYKSRKTTVVKEKTKIRIQTGILGGKKVIQ